MMTPTGTLSVEDKMRERGQRRSNKDMTKRRAEEHRSEGQAERTKEEDTLITIQVKIF